ncbi:integrase, partial [Marinomonas sp. S3726]
APSIEVCRELAVSTPETRVVTPKLRVRWDGHEFDVQYVPGVMIGEKLNVTHNSWREDSVQVHTKDIEGHEQIHVCRIVIKNEFGFAESSAVYGEGYKTAKTTVADTYRDEIEHKMTGADSNTEAEKSRKRKELPLGGDFNPYATL